MSKMLVSINGLAVGRQPTSLGIEHYNLTKSGRVLSGKMVMDIITQKMKLTIAYDVVSGAEYDMFKAAVYDPDVPFFTVQYRENEVLKSFTAYSGAIKASRFRTDGGWYWKNFTVDLIEQ